MNFSYAWSLIVKKFGAWGDSLVRNLPNMLLALVVFLAFYLISRIARRFLEPLLSRLSDNIAVTRLVASIIGIIILLVGFFTALGILKLDKAVTSLLAGAGVIGLALGFAFQDIASNFISGVFIAFQKPYRVGDIVQVQNHEGEVTHITLRTTHIMTFAGIELIVPNKDMFTQTLINYTSTPMRRVELAVGVSYTEDLTRISELLMAELETLPFRIPNLPLEVYYIKFGESSIDLEVRVWIEYPGKQNAIKVRSEMIMRIKRAFDREKITIPYPIRTLDFGIKGGVTLGEALSNPQP